MNQTTNEFTKQIICNKFKRLIQNPSDSRTRSGTRSRTASPIRFENSRKQQQLSIMAFHHPTTELF